MPSRNVLKEDAPDSYYHVYFRGGNRSRIFREPADYEHLLKLFSRYLSLEDSKNTAGLTFPNYSNRIELLSFCLMPNHVHLLVYQHQQGVMAEFMRSLLTSYSMYFNKKYKRSGPLFESRYKASRITNDAYLQHITRYIHLNPKHWRDYDYSSLPYYLHQVTDEWIMPKRILELFESTDAYLQFVEDYEEAKDMMDILKHELAAID
ncbi:transposase [Candidatus Saccharibacteria bacterium]|nr:transposase [Candidatus Saccharibacteria bacterium]